MFVRTENFRTFIRSYPVVTTILAINFLLYFIFLISKWFGFTSVLNLYGLGMGSNYAIDYGQYWRLITPMFLHFTFSHVFFNMFSIFLFAPVLESLLGKWKFSIAYFGTGIISNVLFYIFGPHAIDAFYIGASGAIFGLFGIFLFIITLRRALLDKGSRHIILIILIINVAWTILFQNVNNVLVLGHLFGLLAGFVLGPILLARTRNPYYYNPR